MSMESRLKQFGLNTGDYIFIVKKEEIGEQDFLFSVREVEILEMLTNSVMVKDDSERKVIYFYEAQFFTDKFKYGNMQKDIIIVPSFSEVELLLNQMKDYYSEKYKDIIEMSKCGLFYLGHLIAKLETEDGYLEFMNDIQSEFNSGIFTSENNLGVFISGGISKNVENSFYLKLQATYLESDTNSYLDKDGHYVFDADFVEDGIDFEDNSFGLDVAVVNDFSAAGLATYYRNDSLLTTRDTVLEIAKLLQEKFSNNLSLIEPFLLKLERLEVYSVTNQSYAQ